MEKLLIPKVMNLLLLGLPGLLSRIDFQWSEVKELAASNVSTGHSLTVAGIGAGPEQNLGTASGHTLAEIMQNELIVHTNIGYI